MTGRIALSSGHISFGFSIRFQKAREAPQLIWPAKPVGMFFGLEYTDRNFSSKHATAMFVPITSEITIKTGMVLKEIATDQLFEVSERVANGREVWGEDSWNITEIAPGDLHRTLLALPRQRLSEKYLAEVAD